MHTQAQHYVPQFYLRNFANKRKKGFFICCFDKATQKIFKPNARRVANQIGFYDFVASNGEKISVESSFSDIETRAQIAIQAIIEKPAIATLSKNRTTLANFFALQESRTQAFRDEYDQMILAVNQRLQKDGSFFQVSTENETKEFQARFLFDTSNEISIALLEMKWILVSNLTSRPFWTSDNPIVWYNPHKSELVGNLGLKCSGIQLHIPISPWLAIIICDPFEYAHEDSEKTADSPNIDFNNSGQVLRSRQYIFSIDDNFDLAQKMINETQTSQIRTGKE